MKIELFTFGISTELVKAARWNAEFGEWEINYKTILETYKTMHINPNGIKLSPNQEARRWKMHFERERELWERTKDCWHVWSDDKLLLQAVETGVEQYLQQSPVEVELKHVDDKPKFKGRKTCFKDKMLDDEDGRKLKILHEVIDGKDSNNARLIVDSAISIGWLTKPSGSSVADEFKGISKSTFNNAGTTNKYKDCDLKVIAKTLEDMLNLPPEA